MSLLYSSALSIYALLISLMQSENGAQFLIILLSQIKLVGFGVLCDKFIFFDTPVLYYHIYQ